MILKVPKGDSDTLTVPWAQFCTKMWGRQLGVKPIYQETKEKNVGWHGIL